MFHFNNIGKKSLFTYILFCQNSVTSNVFMILPLQFLKLMGCINKTSNSKVFPCSYIKEVVQSTCYEKSQFVCNSSYFYEYTSYSVIVKETRAKSEHSMCRTLCTYFIYISEYIITKLLHNCTRNNEPGFIQQVTVNLVEYPLTYN